MDEEELGDIVGYAGRLAEETDFVLCGSPITDYIHAVQHREGEVIQSIFNSFDPDDGTALSQARYQRLVGRLAGSLPREAYDEFDN